MIDLITSYSIIHFANTVDNTSHSKPVYLSTALKEMAIQNGANRLMQKSLQYVLDSKLVAFSDDIRFGSDRCIHCLQPDLSTKLFRQLPSPHP